MPFGRRPSWAGMEKREKLEGLLQSVCFQNPSPERKGGGMTSREAAKICCASENLIGNQKKAVKTVRREGPWFGTGNKKRKVEKTINASR